MSPVPSTNALLIMISLDFKYLNFAAAPSDCITSLPEFMDTECDNVILV